MDILKRNLAVVIEVVPRVEINTALAFTMTLKNEATQATQTRACTFVLLANENYNLTLNSFPTGNDYSKFSYIVKQNTNSEVVLRGKLMIVSETEDLQNYNRSQTNKFYK